jgi:hypothetical protein
VEPEEDPVDENDEPEPLHPVLLRRASLLPLTLDGGLRHLLNLRALTSLHLPWIEPDEVDALCQFAKQIGRASLFIERIVPLSRRSLLQRHWVGADSIDTDDS